MSWWSNLSRGERATFFACFGGWALDAFDYQFYTFVIPTLRKEWNISAGQAGAPATAALLPSALGGCLAGLLAAPLWPARTLAVAIPSFAAPPGASVLPPGHASTSLPRAPTRPAL